MVDLSFAFTGECWLWTAENQVCWHFVTLPQDKSDEIKFFSKNLRGQRRGWDMVRVTVTIGKTSWETSIFPYAKTNAYILPIKAEVRKKEKISAGDSLHISLKINV
ncbi:MAG TPA: DUF1905 domain-containing protein [Methylotenera sp.]|nr:DUF1905 domain-containing protein [Methylotenera sp.]HPH05574.1 DUF1905 domain-containing protein [Methylotenera sp.]HPN00012.1 DUF1905 domain-containing protein [Methylotenera sp.]